MNSKSIQDLRERIDAIDAEILRLLSERAGCAVEIGHFKAEAGLPVYDPQREAGLLTRLAAANPGPLSADAVRDIFAGIVRACRNLEQPPRVACLGPLGTFSHQAALEHFGPGSELLAQPDLPEVAEAVVRGEADWGILPVENSIEGIIGVSFDLVAEHGLVVVGERVLPVHLYLVGQGPLEAVQRVVSHPQPLRQARHWLRQHLPGAALETAPSTAEAAAVAVGDPAAAAIVGPMVMHAGTLPPLAGPVEDRPDNRTRFWVVARRGEAAAEGAKTALLMTLPHRPGSLARALEVVARHGLNMTSLTSRPATAQPWEYRFFVDLDGRPDAGLLADLESVGAHVRVLGSFDPAGEATHS